MASKVYQQIEYASDFYPPSTYDLLTFHNSMFERDSDSLAADYYPLTAARLAYREEIIPFVVGILPPAALIKDTTLDRSGDLGGSDSFVELSEEEMMLEGAGGFQVEDETPASSTTTKSGAKKRVVPTETTRLSGDEAYEAFNAAWKKIYGQNIPEAVWPIILAQWSIETAYGANMKNYNFAGIKGFGPTGEQARYMTFEIIKGQRVNMIDGFRAYDSAAAGAEDYLRLLGGKRYKTALAAARRGDPAGFVHELAVHKYFTANEEFYTTCVVQRTARAKKGGPNALSGAPGSARTRAKSRKGSGGGAVKSDTSSGPSYAKKGSKAASEAQRGQAASEKKTRTYTDPNQSVKGQEYQRLQRATIQALQVAQQQMANTPPLQLIISPQSFSVSSSKIISDGNWGRNGAGVGIEHWGDGQDTISATGRVAGFYAVDYNQNSRSGGAGPGLTRMARAFSASYQNLLSLYLIYRNNGGLWLEDFADARGAATTKPNNLTMVGSVYIYYDNTLYVGSFNSFEITEEAEAPFTLSYSFEFVARQTYLLDRDGVMTADGGTEFGYPPANAPIAGPVQKDERYDVWAPP